MKILIVTDAAAPQVNGVVRTLAATAQALKDMGHEILVFGPDPTRSTAVSLPFYKEISIEFFSGPRLRQTVKTFAPDSIHIATEGPLGWAARRLCLKRGWRFTTAYHTRFPEYAAARVPAPARPLVEALVYRMLRRFHAPSEAVMVPTQSLLDALAQRGFSRLVLWSRGVDTQRFSPREKNEKPFVPFGGLTRPLLLSVGRVAKEKNLEPFLRLDSAGSKVVIGDGPDRARLATLYPRVRFLGAITDLEILARAYAAADLFVFPSRSETFGLVLLEACAAGLPIAAYSGCTSEDIFPPQETRAFVVLDKTLQKAVEKALALPQPQASDLARAFALKRGWEASARVFLTHLILK